LHVSQLWALSKPSVSANFKVGQMVSVVILGTDDKGRLKLKMAG
jgi:ribosomal protein S1